ncbi:MAG: response regulator [Thermodesulfobacteriota bacterium]|nr:response regulator [Thermodesulfobacteriota bacterium]
MTKHEAMRILVVDDERDIREGCVRVLRRLDCDVETAENGNRALELMKTEFFPIVLLDLKMPGLDGMDVLREIKTIDETILVIIITGFATVETAIEAMKQGAYDFIPKPFDPAQLRMVVERAQDKIRLMWQTEKLARERSLTLADLSKEKSRISAIVESLPNGVVVTDTSGQVVLINPSFKHLVGLPADSEPGKNIAEYIPDKGVCDMVTEISRGDFTGETEIPSHELALEGKYLIARGRPVSGENGECLGAVVTLGDFTAMKIFDQLKSEFVAKVSHELRSPLSTIHEQLDMVLKDFAKNEDAQEDQYLLSRAKEKTGGLISLIGDLLDLSRIEAGGTGLNIQAVKLDELLKNIVDFLQGRARAKQQTLQLDTDNEPLPRLQADPMALESIFGNLIANAINYTREGGAITVRIRGDNHTLTVSVEDNGFGIDPRHHDKIFEKFYRVKDENTRYITGTGLGLPIVKGLVEQMSGEIRLESQPDSGSTFTVVLPAAG